MLTHVIKCVKEPASHFYLKITPKLTLYDSFKYCGFDLLQDSLEMGFANMSLCK